MPGALFIEGEKVNLRSIEEEDLEFLRDGVNHPQVRQFMGNRKPQNLENQQEFFEKVINEGDDAYFLICKDEQPLGIIGLERKGDRAENLAQTGLWIHPEFHGNGYGSEAAELVTDYGFKKLGFKRIFARAYTGNSASRSIWEKLGYQQEGRLRSHTYAKGEHKDVFYYGVLRGEWM